MTRSAWHGLLAGLLLAAVTTAGAVYIVTLKLEIRRLEQACPAADLGPPMYTPEPRSERMDTA